MKKRKIYFAAAALTVLCILLGGAYKRTCLSEYQTEYRYGYTMEYLFVAEDVPDYVVDALQEGMSLYHGDRVYAGYITDIARDEDNNVTLHITAFGFSPEGVETGSFELTNDNGITLCAQTVQLDGYISRVTYKKG